MNWRLLTPIVTATGSLPLFIFAYYAPSVASPYYLFGYLYASIIMAFIAGIDWAIAIEEQHVSYLLWSVLLSLYPLLIIWQHVALALAAPYLWLQFLALVWLSLFLDWRLFSVIGILYHIYFRLIGSIFLSIAIITCMLRL